MLFHTFFHIDWQFHFNVFFFHLEKMKLAQRKEIPLLLEICMKFSYCLNCTYSHLSFSLAYSDEVHFLDFDWNLNQLIDEYLVWVLDEYLHKICYLCCKYQNLPFSFWLGKFNLCDELLERFTISSCFCCWVSNLLKKFLAVSLSNDMMWFDLGILPQIFFSLTDHYFGDLKSSHSFWLFFLWLLVAFWIF